MSLPFEPYLYLLVAKENIQEVTAFLSKKYGQYIIKTTQVIYWIILKVFMSLKVFFVCRCLKRIWIYTIILLG